MYCSETSRTSAASTDSPDLNVRSITRPLFRFRNRVRTKACPFPGLTNSFSMIEHGSPSIMSFSPERNSLVLTFGIERLP